MSEYVTSIIALKILQNERLTDEERSELRRNLPTVVAAMRGIFMAERRWLAS